MYNGWKNRATWNVALWINNDEQLYKMAVNWVRRRRAKRQPVNWTAFSTETSLRYRKTPDGYSYVSPELCKMELTQMLQELVD